MRRRAWPSPRGAPRSAAQREAQDRFRIVQKAAAYLAPDALIYIRKATEDSPLLVRDVVTMQLYGRWLAFTLPDGRTLMPQPPINDVSEALDVLGNTVGSFLRRTPDGWRTVPGPTVYPFRGCSVSYVNASINISAGFVVPWNVEAFDTDNFHSNTVNPSRFTIPAGVSYVEVTMQVVAFAVTAGTNWEANVRKNGVFFQYCCGGEAGGAIGAFLTGTSGPIPVVQGDYLDIVIRCTDTSVEFRPRAQLKVLA